MIFFPVWDLSDFWMTCHHVFNRKMGCSVFSLLLARNKISVSENENHFVVDPSVTNTSQFTLYTKTTHTKTDFHVKTRARHLKCRSHFPPFSQQTILRLIPFKLHLSLSHWFFRVFFSSRIKVNDGTSKSRGKKGSWKSWITSSPIISLLLDHSL